VAAWVSDQQADPVVHAPHGAGDPQQLEPAPRAGQPVVQSGLHVYVLIRWPRPGYRRKALRIGTEVVKEQPP